MGIFGLLEKDLVEDKIYQDFADQFCKWTEGGERVPAGNQDINHSLRLQRKRLEKHHAKMKYELKLRGDHMDVINGKNLSDAKYTHQMAWRGYQREVSYYIEDKKSLRKKDRETLYQIITRLKKGAAQGQESCCCPNCGSISTVEALLGGCPYCQTRFLISDLFPKVTNFFFIKDLSMSEKESKNQTRAWMLAFFLFGLVFVGIPYLSDAKEEGYGFFITLIGFLFSGAVPAVASYLAMSLCLAVRVFGEAAKQSSKISGQLWAIWKLRSFMKRYDPTFSFDYFAGKVQFLLKILIFSDVRKNLAVYEGVEQEFDFDHIVDAESANAITLNRCRVEGDYCHLDVNVSLADVYVENGRLYKKTDHFRVGVCKNIRKPIDYGFSIKQVSCKSCGASFDALTERHCPYCKTAYSLKEDDWVITHIEKRRKFGWF